MQALTRASERGVKVRIYLEVSNIGKSIHTKHFRCLAQSPSVQIRIKGQNKLFMHLKSYQIDGNILRTGGANFSRVGLKKQDNDLIVIENAKDAAAFKQNFDTYIGSGFAITSDAGQCSGDAISLDAHQ
jgi:phosphatidylserine/phosphatidylglycerophosphate/cardiolipin synthase-like enzyme